MLILQNKVAIRPKENKAWPEMTTKHKERCYKADKKKNPKQKNLKSKSTLATGSPKIAKD